MKLDEIFPSNFLKAADLNHQQHLVTISGIELVSMGDDGNKPVLHFVNMDRGLVLNKTNGQMVGSFLGDETNDWVGKQIVLYSEKVNFQGRIVDSIRVRQPRQPAPVATPPGQAPAPAALVAAQPIGGPVQGDPAQTPAPLPAYQEHMPSGANVAQPAAANTPPQAAAAPAPQQASAAVGAEDDVPF